MTNKDRFKEMGNSSKGQQENKRTFSDIDKIQKQKMDKAHNDCKNLNVKINKLFNDLGQPDDKTKKIKETHDRLKDDFFGLPDNTEITTAEAKTNKYNEIHEKMQKIHKDLYCIKNTKGKESSSIRTKWNFRSEQSNSITSVFLDKTEFDALIKQIQDGIQQIDKKNNAIKERDNAIDHLRKLHKQDREISQKQNQSLENRLNESKQEILNLNKTIKDLTEKVGKYEKNIQVAQEMIQDLNILKDDDKTQLDQEKMKTFSVGFKKLELQNQQLNQQIDNLTAWTESLQEGYKGALNIQHELSTKKVEEVTEIIKQLKISLDQYKEELDNVRKHSEEKEAAFIEVIRVRNNVAQDLQNQIIEMSNANIALQDKNELYKSASEMQNKYTKDLQEEKDKLQVQNDLLNSENSEKDQTIINLQKQLEELHKQLADAKKQNTSAAENTGIVKAVSDKKLNPDSEKMKQQIEYLENLMKEKSNIEKNCTYNTYWLNNANEYIKQIAEVKHELDVNNPEDKPKVENMLKLAKDFIGITKSDDIDNIKNFFNKIDNQYKEYMQERNNMNDITTRTKYEEPIQANVITLYKEALYKYCESKIGENSLENESEIDQKIQAAIKKENTTKNKAINNISEEFAATIKNVNQDLEIKIKGNTQADRLKHLKQIYEDLSPKKSDSES